MHDTLSITTSAAPLRLRTITANDLEPLRLWKNAHREAFFFQQEITPEMQADWFTGYLTRPNDTMFMVESTDPADVAQGIATIGCVGVRVLDGMSDIYNLMRGSDAWAGRGAMLVAMRMAMAYGLTLAPTVGLKVMRTNPAWKKYESVGYSITATHPTYYEMTLDLARFVAPPIEIVTTPSPQ